jgi:hypothetical protein
MPKAAFFCSKMIKKITCAKDFEKVWKDLDALFREENSKYGHHFLKFSAQSVIDSFAHDSLLNNSIHCWANFENGNADGVIMFADMIQPFLAQRIFMEYFWISKNPQKSFALYRQAVKFAKSKKIQYIIMNCVENHPSSAKLKKIYRKLGYKKDSTSYIKTL